MNSNKTINPTFDYEKDHELYISPYVMSHIYDGSITIGVYGKMSQDNIDQIIKTAAKDKPKQISNIQVKSDSKTSTENKPSPVNNTPTTPAIIYSPRTQKEIEL